MHGVKSVILDHSHLLSSNPGGTNTTAVSLQAVDPKYQLAAAERAGLFISSVFCDLFLG